MLGMIITQVLFTRCSVDMKSTLFATVLQPVIAHVNYFRSFLFDRFSHEPNCRSIVYLYWGGILYCVAMNPTPISASAAADMPHLMIFDTTCIGPFSGTRVQSRTVLGCLLNKKCAPTRLRAFGTDRYEASL